jgi:N4-gp56 family major capsid protein
VAAAITTTSTITKPVNVIFQQTLLRTARPLCPYFNGSVPGEITEHQGSFTAAWRRIENLTPTTTALAELTGNESLPTRDSITPSITNVTTAVQKYGQYVLLNEEVDLVNFNGTTDDLVKKLAISAGRSLNMLQRNEMEDNATLVNAGAAASAGAVNSKITTTVIAKVINDLARNVAFTFTAESDGSTNVGTVPILPGYYGACHPDVAYDIAQLTGFVSVEKYAGQVALMPGEFGLFPTAGYSVRFCQTSDATIDLDIGAALGTGFRGATKNDLYTVPIWGMDAVGSLGLGFEHLKETYTAGDKLPGIQVINKSRGSSGVADPLDELGTLGWKSWHAPKILNTNWIASIRCTATKLS